jgi:hypothetical protein
MLAREGGRGAPVPHRRPKQPYPSLTAAAEAAAPSPRRCCAVFAKAEQKPRARRVILCGGDDGPRTAASRAGWVRKVLKSRRRNLTPNRGGGCSTTFLRRSYHWEPFHCCRKLIAGPCQVEWRPMSSSLLNIRSKTSMLACSSPTRCRDGWGGVGGGSPLARHHSRLPSAPPASLQQSRSFAKAKTGAGCESLPAAVGRSRLSPLLTHSMV